MTLAQMRYLIAVVDAGLNLTVAAERVHATQPGLSKQLRALEDELGFALLTRYGKRLTGLTELGSEVAERARRIVDEARSIRALAANARGEASGDLTLICTQTLARFVLPQAVSALRQRYPKVRVGIQASDPIHITETLAKGHADVALASSGGDAPAGGLAVPLFRWRRVAILPVTHPLAGREELRLDDLAQHPLLAYASTTRPGSSLAAAFANRGLHPEYALTAGDAGVIATYVESGLGIGIVAEMCVPSLPPSLCAVALEAAIPACTTYALLPANRLPRDYTLDLLALISEGLDLRALRRVIAGTEEPRFPLPPWYQSGTGAAVAAG